MATIAAGALSGLEGEACSSWARRTEEKTPRPLMPRICCSVFVCMYVSMHVFQYLRRE